MKRSSKQAMKIVRDEMVERLRDLESKQWRDWAPTQKLRKRKVLSIWGDVSYRYTSYCCFIYCGMCWWWCGRMFIRLVSIDLISLLIVLQVCMKFSSLVSLSAEGCAAGSPTPPAERLVPFWQVDRSFWGRWKHLWSQRETVNRACRQTWWSWWP